MVWPIYWTKQHFIHSVFRAIESGKYVARSSNNGISAIINPLGVIEQKVTTLVKLVILIFIN